MRKIKRGKNVINLQDGNLQLLLELLRMHPNATRQDLSDLTGLSPSGISKLVGFLITKGLVVEHVVTTGAKGRRAISLRLNAESVYTVGVRLARNYIKCGLFNFNGDIVYQKREEVRSKQLSETKRTLSNLIKNTLQEAVRKKAAVYGIGISAPGPLFSYDGRLALTSNYPEWQGFSIKHYCEDEFGLKTVVEHDANVSVLAEKWCGKGKNCENLIYVVADRGVGAGIYYKGQIYTGHQNVAGEIGHTTIDYSGEKCECGNKGCLEMYCSSTAVLNQAKELWPADSNSLTVARVAHLATAGDKQAHNLLITAGTFLGIGLTNLINTYNPEMIIIGDEMTQGGELWFSAIKEAVRERTLQEIFEQTIITVSDLDPEPAFLGTGLLITNLIIERVSSIEEVQSGTS